MTAGPVGPSRYRRPNHEFLYTELHLRVRNIRVPPSRVSVALIDHSSTGDVVVVCHDQVRRQVSQGFRCRDS